MNTPDYYFLKPDPKGYQFSVGGCDTMSGLRAIAPNTEVELLDVAATNFRNLNWGEVKDFPAFKTVQEVVDFFEEEGDVGLIQFEIRIGDIGWLTTHDDGECHFLLREKSAVYQVLQHLSPPAHSALLFSKLLQRPGQYLELLPEGSLCYYADFDSYVASQGNNS